MYNASVTKWVVQHGVDAQFGARPLKRFVQRHVETLVAKQLLSQQVAEQQTLTLTVINDELNIK